MNNTRTRSYRMWIIGAIALVVLLSGIFGGSHLVAKPADTNESISGATNETKSGSADLTAQRQTDIIAKYKAQPLVHAEGKAPAQTTYVAARSHIVGKDCRQCHTEDLATMTKTLGAAKAAHWTIKLKHATADKMNCRTCHADYNPAELKAGQVTVSLDQAYQLCSTCHFQQHRDWQGGAHGKRLGGWAGPRVIQNCTGCHNPHAPQFPKQFPKTQPRVPRVDLKGAEYVR